MKNRTKTNTIYKQLNPFVRTQRGLYICKKDRRELVRVGGNWAKVVAFIGGAFLLATQIVGATTTPPVLFDGGVSEQKEEPHATPVPEPTIEYVPAGKGFEPDTTAERSEYSGHDDRVARLQAFLERYNSPLAGYSAELIALADRYGVDVGMAVGITGKETSFGKVTCFGHRFNVGCHRIFRQSVSSFVEGFEEHMKLLASPLYAGKTIEQIVYTYAPPTENDSAEYVRQLRAFMEELKI